VGNAPSVTGPDLGRSHVKRDMTKGDKRSGLRPANYSTSESGNELVIEDEVELFSRKELARGTNRKSSDEVTQRSSFSYNEMVKKLETAMHYVTRKPCQWCDAAIIKFTT